MISHGHDCLIAVSIHIIGYRERFSGQIVSFSGYRESLLQLNFLFESFNRCSMILPLVLVFAGV
jgi:hypothetical protein